MERTFGKKKFGVKANIGLTLIMLILNSFGCQDKPAPLSPAAANFKQEIKTCITNLSAALKEPMAKKDVAAIYAALEKAESPAVQLCRFCPFQVGVLNKAGEALAVYPSRSGNGTKNFSRYDLINKVIQSKKIQQQRFFLQNGSELYIICAPLFRENVMTGLIAIAINSKDAEKRWDLKQNEFLGLDFNT